MAKRTLQELTKESREMEERFMILEEMLRDERAAGRREGLQEGELNGQRAMLRSFLEDLGSIPPELEKKLFEESDATVLKNWFTGLSSYLMLLGIIAGHPPYSKACHNAIYA